MFRVFVFFNNKSLIFSIIKNNDNTNSPTINFIPRNDAYSMASAGVVWKIAIIVLGVTSELANIQ